MSRNPVARSWPKPGDAVLGRPTGALLWLGGGLAAAAVAGGNLALLGLALLPLGLAVASALGPHARIVGASVTQDPERAVVVAEVVRSVAQPARTVAAQSR